MPANRNAEIAPRKWTLADVMGGDHQNASRVEAMTMIAASIDREALAKGISACDQALAVGHILYPTEFRDGGAERARCTADVLRACDSFVAVLHKAVMHSGRGPAQHRGEPS